MDIRKLWALRRISTNKRASRQCFFPDEMPNLSGLRELEAVSHFEDGVGAAVCFFIQVCFPLTGNAGCVE